MKNMSRNPENKNPENKNPEKNKSGKQKSGKYLKGRGYLQYHYSEGKKSMIIRSPCFYRPSDTIHFLSAMHVAQLHSWSFILFLLNIRNKSTIWALASTTMTSIVPSFSRDSHYWWLQRNKLLIRLPLTSSFFLLAVSSMINKFQINFFLIYTSPDFFFSGFFFSGFLDNTLFFSFNEISCRRIQTVQRTVYLKMYFCASCAEKNRCFLWVEVRRLHSF